MADQIRREVLSISHPVLDSEAHPSALKLTRWHLKRNILILLLMYCMKLNELFVLFFYLGIVGGENLDFYIVKLNVILHNRVQGKLRLLIQTVGVW